MPRPTRARRFEPRFGVSREMLAIEAKEVQRELRSYSRLTTEDLRSRLAERKAKGSASSDSLRQRLNALAERDRIALECMLVRDVYHLLELYLTHLDAGVPAGPIQKQVTPEAEVLEFSEWLFADVNTR